MQFVRLFLPPVFSTSLSNHTQQTSPHFPSPLLPFSPLLNFGGVQLFNLDRFEFEFSDA